MLIRILTCLCILNLTVTKRAKDVMDPFIVGGNFSIIEDFPHVAFLHIKCKKVGATYCGASIVNQVILLTAAHCLHSCSDKHNFSIRAYTGSVQKYKGRKNIVVGFKVHENYIHKNFTNDVAMLVVKDNIRFGKAVQKITLMKQLPEYKIAEIAGWGWIDDQSTKTDLLKFTSQEILSNEECLKKIPGIPPGTICGHNPSGSHPQRGDSGSALLIHKHIQIGIASFFKRNLSNKTLIYTYVPYFYDWIDSTAKDLFCQHKHMKIKEKEIPHICNCSCNHNVNKKARF
ncbi:mast cell protease 1A-like [Leguminivora glycinivorella]|uniref:mast cell protease 1A-like n=1 Tax=Leguminivora glycinivorella TaxID=1035111 RepID=UPI00200FBF90|nr:mast cell protease 1A-like [Leguminivora glycinivorella]